MHGGDWEGDKLCDWKVYVVKCVTIDYFVKWKQFTRFCPIPLQCPLSQHGSAEGQSPVLSLCCLPGPHPRLSVDRLGLPL